MNAFMASTGGRAPPSQNTPMPCAGGVELVEDRTTYVEITSGAPRERTEITLLAEGKVELVMGTMSSGQGHETSFAQLVTEWLGVLFECVSYSPTTPTALRRVAAPIPAGR
jgi:hypothetical protein